MNRCTGGLSHTSWLFDSLLWGISSGFPMASRPDLPGSEPILGISQDPPMGAWVCISRPMGRYHTTSYHTTSDLQGAFLLGRFPGLRNEKYVVSYVSRAQHPFLIVMLLIFWSLSTDELQLLILELWAGGIYLLPQK